MIHSNDSARSGHYELSRPLGQDALTCAFAARHTGGGHLVRLELLHPELARNERFRARFLDQAAAMLALSHPALPRVEEVLSQADVCGVALELVPGRTLAQVLQRAGRGRCPVDLHLYWLRRVLSGLEHAHRAPGSGSSRAGFVHGDVSPSRVHVGYGGEVQLLGGGLATCRHALSVERGRSVLDVRYAAPEVLLGEPAGPSADLFSLGVMLWEALARQSRTVDADLASVSRRRTLGSEPDLESVWPDAPESLVQLCARALAFAPHERYSSAAEMAVELDAYLARAAEPSAVVLGRVPAWLAATFGESDDRWTRNDGLSASDDGPPPSRRSGVSSPTPASDAAQRESTAAPPLDGARVGHASAAPEPAPRQSDTGGHRAFSSTWNGPRSAPRSSPWPAARAALPALAVAAGAIGAVWVLAQRASGEHAAPPAARLAAPSVERVKAAASSSATQGRYGAADAGAEHRAAPPAAAPLPAFFAGRVSSAALRANTSPPLAPDELPQVDDPRDSLQVAILRATRAQRRALRQRRAKTPTAAASAPPAITDPRDRDE